MNTGQTWKCRGITCRCEVAENYSWCSYNCFVNWIAGDTIDVCLHNTISHRPEETVKNFTYETPSKYGLDTSNMYNGGYLAVDEYNSFISKLKLYQRSVILPTLLIQRSSKTWFKQVKDAKNMNYLVKGEPSEWAMQVVRTYQEELLLYIDADPAIDMTVQIAELYVYLKYFNLDDVKHIVLNRIGPLPQIQEGFFICLQNVLTPKIAYDVDLQKFNRPRLLQLGDENSSFQVITTRFNNLNVTYNKRTPVVTGMIISSGNSFNIIDEFDTLDTALMYKLTDEILIIHLTTGEKYCLSNDSFFPIELLGIANTNEKIIIDDDLLLGDKPFNPKFVPDKIFYSELFVLFFQSVKILHKIYKDQISFISEMTIDNVIFSMNDFRGKKLLTILTDKIHADLYVIISKYYLA